MVEATLRRSRQGWPFPVLPSSDLFLVGLKVLKGYRLFLFPLINRFCPLWSFPHLPSPTYRFLIPLWWVLGLDAPFSALKLSYSPQFVAFSLIFFSFSRSSRVSASLAIFWFFFFPSDASFDGRLLFFPVFFFQVFLFRRPAFSCISTYFPACENR